MSSKNRTQGVFSFVVALSPFDFTFPLRRNPAVWSTFIICFWSQQQQQQPESQKATAFTISKLPTYFLQSLNFQLISCKTTEVSNLCQFRRKRFQTFWETLTIKLSSLALWQWNIETGGIGDKLVKILGIPEINGKVGEEEENGGAAGQLQRHALKNETKRKERIKKQKSIKNKEKKG